MKRRSDRIEFLHSDGSTHEGLLDLSATGMALFQKQSRVPGSTLTIQLENLTLTALVIYSQEKVGGYKIGLQFSGLKHAEQATLEGLVEKFSRGTTLHMALDAHRS